MTTQVVEQATRVLDRIREIAAGNPHHPLAVELRSLVDDYLDLEMIVIASSQYTAWLIEDLIARSEGETELQGLLCRLLSECQEACAA